MNALIGSLRRLAASVPRRRVRWIAAAVSAACAIVYFAIGAGLIYPAAGKETGLLVFGAGAGAAFALGAVLLLTSERRAVLVLGALFQVFVIVAYVAVARQRTPPFEIWGISLKLAQAAILVALVALLVRSDATTAPGEGAQGPEARTAARL